jgi:hypothetical protein
LKLSKTSLLDEAAATGFRPDTLEKVIRLLDLLTQINQDNFLTDRLVLKGGTALNLFVFDMPRLSVDIDVNYIGSLDLATMQKERPRVEELLTAICQRAGYTLNRIAPAHAGGKWRLGYQSAMGGQANLELDLNYMFRVNFQHRIGSLPPTSFVPRAASIATLPLCPARPKLEFAGGTEAAVGAFVENPKGQARVCTQGPC